VDVSAIDERTNGLVAAAPRRLVQLVRQAVDAELARLVDTELARRNGKGHAPVAAPAEKPACAVSAGNGRGTRAYSLLAMTERQKRERRAEVAQAAETEPPHEAEAAGEERQSEPVTRPAL
jgi:hypothetical protein